MPNKSKNYIFLFLIFLIPLIVILGLVGYSLGIFKEPELKLVSSNFPKQVFKLNSFPITATNSKLNVNGKEIIGDNYKFNIPLSNGKNTLNIASTNAIGRQSPIKTIELNNIQNDWNKSSCNELDFVLNTDSMQYGYSGITNDELPEFRARLLDISKNDYGYVKLLKFNCDQAPAQVQNHARIYPKGTKASCWNCDGNSSYINIESSPANQNTPAPSLITELNEFKQETVYSSLAGLNFRITQFKSPDNSQSKLIATYEKNNRNYVITGLDYNPGKHEEFNKNYYSVLDNIYPSDYNKNTLQKFNQELKNITFKDSNFNGFKVDYKSNWQMLSYTQEDYQDQQNPIKGYKLLELKKEDYTIRFRFYPSTDTSITSGAIDTKESESKYTKIDIDSKSIQIPKVSNIISTGFGNSNNIVRVLDKEVNINGKNENSYSFIISTQNKKIEINIEYLGLNYEYVDGVTKKIPSKSDDKVDSEIIEIFKSIKWGE